MYWDYQEPLLYFSEADIQQLLTEKLKKIKALKKTYPTSIHRGKNSEGIYKTSLLHREYGGGAGTRIDIVIFSENDVKQIDNPNLKKGKNYIYPEFAFELGTEKTINIGKHLVNDIKKLAILLSPFKDQTLTKGKCEILNGNIWEKVNVNDKSVLGKKNYWSIKMNYVKNLSICRRHRPKESLFPEISIFRRLGFCHW